MMSTCADFPDQDPYVHLPSLRSTRVDEWTSGRYPMQVYTGTSGHLGIWASYMIWNITYMGLVDLLTPLDCPFPHP